MIALREPRGDRVPQHVIVRIAVQEQQGRAGTAMAHADDGALRAHVEMLESREQGRDFGAAPAHRIAGIIGRRSFGCHGGLFRQCRRGDARRYACGQCLNQTAAVQACFQACFNVFGLKMRGHFSLPGQVSTKRWRRLGGKPFELYQRRGCNSNDHRRAP